MRIVSPLNFALLTTPVVIRASNEVTTISCHSLEEGDLCIFDYLRINNSALLPDIRAVTGHGQVGSRFF
jgi:uncharacterized protein YqfA (UPF0365 family)